MKQAIGLFGSALSLVGLYLVLRNAAGATQILKSVGSSSVGVFRTLQGR